MRCIPGCCRSIASSTSGCATKPARSLTRHSSRQLAQPGALLFIELPGVGHVSLSAGGTQIQDEIQRFLTDVWQTGGWEDAEPDRMLATVLFTDIVGATARAAELGDRAWRQLLERHHETVRKQLSRFRGRQSP